MKTIVFSLYCRFILYSTRNQVIFYGNRGNTIIYRKQGLIPRINTPSTGENCKPNKKLIIVEEETA